jgi:hypothetical protein
MDETMRATDDSVANEQGALAAIAASRVGRRAVVLGAAASACAAIGAVAASSPAAAADGDGLLLGQANTAASTTSVSTTYGDGLMATTTQNGQNGVEGEDKSPKGGQGVRGSSTAGFGVYGISTDGVGVYAQSAAGPALKVEGPAVFSRSGGVTIRVGEESATVTGVDLTENSIVLLTIQKAVPGLYALGVVKDVPAKEFTIQLSNMAPEGHPAEVGWFIVN